MKLFGSLSHELRTPLNCSISMQEALECELLQIKQQSMINDYLKPSLHSSKLQLSLINDILDVVQLETGTIKYTFIEFDLQNLLRECLTLVSIQASMKLIKLDLNYDPNISRNITSDPNRIRQIILNFLSNALKFTEKGEININVSKEISNHQDKQQYLIPNSYNNFEILSISVQDTGIGIKKEDQKKIFNLCNKVDLGKYSNKNAQGCGIGLGLSNSLAKHLGPCSIKFQSEYEVGSQFTILIYNQSNTSKQSILEFVTGSEIQLQPILQTQFIKKKNQVLREKYFQEGQLQQSDNSIDNTEDNYQEENVDEKHQEKNLLNEENKTQSYQFSQNSKYLEESYSNHNNQFSTDQFQCFIPKQTGQKQNLEICLDKKQSVIKRLSMQQCDCPNLLIVDDNQFNIIAICQLLKDLQLKYDTTSNGQLAVDKVIHKFENNECCKQYPLIFMDLDMPILNGYEASKQIFNYLHRQDIKNKQYTKILACTAYIGEEDQEKALQVGMIDTMGKPIHKTSLHEVLYEHMQILKEEDNQHIINENYRIVSSEEDDDKEDKEYLEEGLEEESEQQQEQKYEKYHEQDQIEINDKI